jgi:hydroxymethylpyrimidine/phosphomethylpyrimidine kinase
MIEKKIHPSRPAVLTVAGSDCSGGAGIQADLKTFAAFGVYGMSAVTAVTAQNSRGVRDYWAISPKNVASQMKSVFEDIGAEAVKTGMLVDEHTVGAVAEVLKEYSAKNLVLDPVITAKDGTFLLSLDAIHSLSKSLFPLSRLVTPNTYEAAILAGMDKVATPEAMKEAALRIMDTGTAAVLVKGGHLKGERLFDILFDGRLWHEFVGERISDKEPHGTGCTLSAAITACLAKGAPLTEAVETARSYTRSAISAAMQLGEGYAFLDHNAAGNWSKKKIKSE